MVVARLIAAATALVITGGPALTAVCEAMCAVRANDAGSSMATHHSCHHETTPPGIAVISATHVCGHADEPAKGVAASVWSSDSPALVITVYTLRPPAAHLRRVHTVRADHGPPFATPTSQLRI